MMSEPAGDRPYAGRDARTAALWVLAALAAIALGALLPPLLPVVGVALVVAGTVALRRSETTAMRAVATALIAAGVVLLVMSLVLVAGLVSVDSGGGATSGGAS